MRFTGSFLILASLLFPVPIAAQQPPERDAQALAVVRNGFMVLGGSLALSGLRDTVAKGQVAQFLPDKIQSYEVTIRTLGRDRTRVDAVKGAEAQIAVIRATAGAKFSASKRQVLAGHEVLPMWPFHIPLLLPLSEIENSTYSFQYLGLEIVSGLPAQRIATRRLDPNNDEADAFLAELTYLEVFLDATTFLPVKLLYFARSTHDWRVKVPVEKYYSDYRDFAGTKIPFRITTFINQHKFTELVLTSFASNVGLSDADFSAR